MAAVPAAADAAAPWVCSACTCENGGGSLVCGACDAPAAPFVICVDVDGEVFNIKITPVLGQTVETGKKAKSREIPKGAALSPMQGMVLTVKVKVGDKVKEGDTVVVLEAMKMQSDVHSPYTGTVKEIFAFNGEIVNKDDVLMVIE